MKIKKLVIILLCLGLFFGCSSKRALNNNSRLNINSSVQNTEKKAVQGVHEYIYEPPMVDIVDVPPGLDPEGIYYRPQHTEAVEIREGRWKYLKQKTK